LFSFFHFCFLFIFSRTSRRAARHYIKLTREKIVIQFIRETGPENHTNEAMRRTKHTQSSQQTHTLSSHRPRRRVNRTQDLKTASQLRQNNSKETLTLGWHALTYSPPKTPRDGRVNCRTRPDLKKASPRGVKATVHCAQDAHAPSGSHP
jgi:hypothetical protein